MPQELQEWLPRTGVLSYEEILRTIRVGTRLGIHKVRVTGGEPLTRRDITEFFRELGKMSAIDDIGVSTNGTLLAKLENGATMAEHLVKAGVRTANVSLDTLDREAYAHATGRDYLPRVFEGLAAAKDAGFQSIKLNAVLQKGTSEEQLAPLLDFAHEHGHLLRFIELMPVSTKDVLSEENFLPTNTARRLLESHFGGELKARPDFKTNGPASYYQVPGRDQLVGFIGAMTNLHFCESCNKLRLTCDGKLRPCLGSYLEFDLLTPLRDGATDDELAALFQDVVDKKPKDHDFRDNYQPNRKMVAIGG